METKLTFTELEGYCDYCIYTSNLLHYSKKTIDYINDYLEENSRDYVRSEHDCSGSSKVVFEKKYTIINYKRYIFIVKTIFIDC